MNIPILTTHKVALEIHLEFTDGTTWSTAAPTRIDMSYGGVVCVVGRTPEEVVKMELEHSGSRYRYPLEIDSTGEHLKTVRLFGERDYWSQVLRNKAMEVDEDGN
jgi:hypothetical protein